MITATIVPGHRVASGLNGDPRFPGGTIRLQMPAFLKHGIDLGSFHPGTLNVSTAPFRHRVLRARHTVRQLKWHPVEPPEDFSFFDVTVHRTDAAPVSGWIYLPHPDTKPAHFQRPDVLELLLPWMDDVAYGSAVRLEVPADQMAFEL
ncbi:MAG: hypothetical protein K1X78_22565 [Verrucomicrobiaceae bacterium]|nr:hypothetical protein [Verrucomicrobiaceae bacterium]